MAEISPGQIINLEEAPYNEWYWYGDGSGGPEARDIPLRRCGWSIVAIKMGEIGWELAGAWSGALAGDLQTVPRAELTPFQQLCMRTHGRVEYHTDHQNLVDGLRKGLQHHPEVAQNPDLWHDIGNHMRARRGRAGASKVPSHKKATEDDVDCFDAVQVRNLVGNTLADTIADLEAEWARVDEDARDNYYAAVKLQSEILQRLVVTGMQAFATKREKLPKELKIRETKAMSLANALRDTQHWVRQGEFGYHCLACQTGANHRRATLWLREPCRACKPDEALQAPLPDAAPEMEQELPAAKRRCTDLRDHVTIHNKRIQSTGGIEETAQKRPCMGAQESALYVGSVEVHDSIRYA